MGTWWHNRYISYLDEIKYRSALSNMWLLTVCLCFLLYKFSLITSWDLEFNMSILILPLSIINIKSVLVFRIISWSLRIWIPLPPYSRLDFTLIKLRKTIRISHKTFKLLLRGYRSMPSLKLKCFLTTLYIYCKIA